MNQVKRSKFDIRDYRIKPQSVDFPEQYELPKIPVRNQGSSPTCTAHAAASLIERFNLKETGEYSLFSTEFIYGSQLDTAFDGMSVREAVKILKDYGDPKLEDCPGNHKIEEASKHVQKNFEEYVSLAYPYRIEKYYRVKTSDEIKTAILSGSPVIFYFFTKEGAKIRKGVYTYSNDTNHGAHCMLIVGWNTIGWICQNSWGPDSGIDGYFTLPYSFEINDAFGAVDMVNDTSINIVVKKKSAIRTLLYKIINLIMNLIYNIKYKNR